MDGKRRDEDRAPGRDEVVTRRHPGRSSDASCLTRDGRWRGGERAGKLSWLSEVQANVSVLLHVCVDSTRALVHVDVHVNAALRPLA